MALNPSEVGAIISAAVVLAGGCASVGSLYTTVRAQGRRIERHETDITKIGDVLAEMRADVAVIKSTVCKEANHGDDDKK